MPTDSASTATANLQKLEAAVRGNSALNRQYRILLPALCAVFLHCGGRSEAPALTPLSPSELLKQAEILVIGRVTESRELAQPRSIKMTGADGRSTNVLFTPYEYAIAIEKWVRGPRTDETHISAYVFRIDHKVFRAKYDRLNQTRLWCLRKENDSYRVLTDSGSSSLDLAGVRQVDRVFGKEYATVEDLAMTFLSTDLANHWPQYDQQLENIIEWTGDVLPRDQVQNSLRRLQSASSVGVRRAVCKQMYVLFDECRESAGDPQLQDIERLRKAAR